MFKTIKRTAAALTVAAGLILGTALAGNALTYSPSKIYEGQPITVVSSSSNLPAGDYKVSVCTTKGYGIFRAPECVEGVNYSTFKAGRISVTIPGVKREGNLNVHKKWLVFQHKEFSCLHYGDCEILIVDHSKNHVFPKILERQLIEVLAAPSGTRH